MSGLGWLVNDFYLLGLFYKNLLENLITYTCMMFDEYKCIK